jgi:hypothetical protein
MSLNICGIWFRVIKGIEEQLTTCAPVLAPFLSTGTPSFTPLHADSLGLSF